MIGSLCAERAHAGAWSQEQGKSQSITSLSRDTGEFGKKYRIDTYLDYGFGGGWAVNFKAETELASQSAYEERSGFRVGLQKSFALGQRAAIGLQASLLGGETVDGPICVGDGYETRGMLGSSYSLAGHEGFVNIEAGWRSRGESCERVLGEAAAGIDLTSRWRAIAKVWGEQGEDGAKSAKVQASLYRDFGAFSLGLGYHEEVSNAFEERGALVVFWTRL